AVQKFKAKGAAGLVMDVTSGEILALVSLPDFDPNNPGEAQGVERINRINVGVYEMGSTFKALTTAMALDSGRFTVDSLHDARAPLVFGRFRIRDFQGKGRWLTTAEAFIYSSNISMARMAMSVGIEAHKAFLKKMGQFMRLRTELPESAQPIVPTNWGEVTTATIAFGHGMAVAPLQAAMAVAGLVNGGTLIAPTFIKGTNIEQRVLGRNLVKPATSEALRYLMRLNAEKGSAKNAAIDGYDIGGKTGSAEKVINGRYAEGRLLTSFMGVVPISQPKYLFLTMLDEPQALPEPSGYATSGWNAVPTTRTIMMRTLPLLGVQSNRLKGEAATKTAN
ncbi:MAG: penicillin-binding protein 2, partial [Rhizobiales bacterium]|nr:penicillin-binding protein 2 [Hyphomicrobiales bacterium]